MSEQRMKEIMEAGERICEIFEELHLTMDERAIVAYSTYITAKKFETLEELVLGTKEQPQKIPKVQIFTAVCSTLAVIISLICIFLRLSQ